ncbi:hypothetical protein DDE82_005888 [Stemphylium lycopersici]|uniref:Uncharacterized protein n=1 Tax=Stemphylium lycopersici TaxID=183478 RepID=A0A364MS00_STELY|nr:hypothetical protein TW65_01645 [Stemphylium lycopersici]RAR01570.1 hypothetical protein DDE83_008872 [Stemphylium lycopersici]RAR02333.1 hypothetical protein DDE82_005888 [Stemphylium lycopersici]
MAQLFKIMLSHHSFLADGTLFIHDYILDHRQNFVWTFLNIVLCILFHNHIRILRIYIFIPRPSKSPITRMTCTTRMTPDNPRPPPCLREVVSLVLCQYDGEQNE